MSDRSQGATGGGRRGPVRGVLFDKDGTLFDFQKTWSAFGKRIIMTLADGDLSLAVKLADAAGVDPATGRFRADAPIVAGSSGQVVETWAALLPGRAPRELEAWLNAEAAALDPAAIAPAAPDLAAFLDGLRARDLKLGVATHDSEAAATAQLSGIGVLDRFDFLAGYDSGFAAKPDAAMLLGFCEAVSLAPGEVVVVGDSAHDLGMARAGGAAAAIGVLTGVATECDLAHLADVILAGIPALPAWLDGR